MAVTSLRRRLYLQLEPSARDDGLSVVNRLVAGFIVAAAVVAVLETEVTIRQAVPGLLLWAEVCFVTIFSVEYAARFFAAGEEARYAGLRGRLRYLFSRWSLIDLMAILPFVLTLGGVNLALVRVLRFFRLLRLARMGQFGTAIMVMRIVVFRRRHELLLSLAVAGGLLILSASLLYAAESEAQPEAFGSIPRALWWAVATLTTVGYGDVTPVTVIGKIIAGFAAAAGIGLVAMPTGILAAAFSEALQEHKERQRAAADEKRP